MTASAAYMMPGAAWSAWALAAMQAACISDPSQMAHAASAHDAVAAKVQAHKADLNNAVAQKIPPTAFSSQDKDAFTNGQVQPFTTALDQTAALHTSISKALEGQATVHSVTAGLSLLIGGIMLTTAVSSVAAEATLIGAPAAIAAQNAVSLSQNTLFRSALIRLQAYAGTSSTFLTSVKGLLALLGAGAFENAFIGPQQVKAASAGSVPAPQMTYTKPQTA